MSTRLIVKGLPKHATEDSVRKWFGDAVGDVTDARVMRTGDGRTRQFGFVGFASADKAAEAKRIFHGTFMDTSKLSIELARPRGDKQIPRAWSRYTEGSRMFKPAPQDDPPPAALNNTPAVASKLPAHPHESFQEDFAEFKQAVKPRSQKNVWADDVPTKETETLVKSKKFGGENTTLKRSHVVFNEPDQDLSDDQQSSASSDQYHDGLAESNVSSPASIPKENIAADPNVTDTEYFSSKIATMLEDDDSSSDDDTQSPDGSNGETPPSSHESGDGQRQDDTPEPTLAAQNQPKRPALPPTKKKPAAIYQAIEEDCSETGRLFIRNLAFTVAEDDLELLFEKYGALAEVHLCLDKETKTSRGTAFVMYVIPENALRALDALDGTIFQGRLLHVLPAKSKPDNDKNPEAQIRPGTSSYKRKQEDRQRDAAKNSTDSDAWNTLFMRTDAVADVLAQRMGVSKMEVYGADAGESGSAAVRLATGEAKLQQEARRALRAEGINVDAFRGDNVRLKRSKTIFLAKNLSKDVTFSDLKGLFAPYGPLGRLVVVPSSLLAVVEFLEPRDARQAYSGLAYTRVGNSPLYLEWAPLDSFLDHAQSASEAKSAETDKADPQEKHEDSSCSIFVKNLNFETTDEILQHFFSKVGEVRSARVARKRGTKSEVEGLGLSAGYGFVEYSTKDQAKDAVKRLQGKSLDGHKLDLRFSSRGSVAPGADTTDRTKKVAGKSAKLLVKNIAFEATVKDLRGVFGGFGQLKSARMPKRGTGQHRGYGFVEFGSKGEAAEALETLRDTHLYGRHLVIDYAEDDPNSVDELIERASKRSRAG